MYFCNIQKSILAALALASIACHSQGLQAKETPASFSEQTTTTLAKEVVQPIKIECCKQLQVLTKTPLPTKPSELKLDETTPTFDFENGSQTYVFLELPPYKKPYHINITNVPQAPGIFNRSEFSQIPLRIELLDESFNRKRAYKYQDMKKRGLGFEKTIFINPTNESEKYLLVYGDIKALPEEKTISESAVTATGAISGLALTLLVAAATGGAYIPVNTIIADGVDRKVSVAANDKGILLIEPKGLATE
jgi:hypothetical protein